MKIKKSNFLLIFLLIFCFILTTCSNQPKIEEVTRTNFLLGTIIDITIYGTKDSTIIDAAMQRISDIEAKMSLNIDSSELIKLHETDVAIPLVLSSDTFTVIEKGLYYSNLSQGLFDISIGPLVKLWGIGSDKAHIPTDAQIKAALELVNYKQVKLDKNNNTATLLQKDMLIDLGAIAKGYAADAVKEVLLEKGVKSAIVSLGGNLITIGNNKENQAWKIGIQNPFDNDGEYIGIIEIVDKSLVSSGNYQRYFEVDDKRYHHILDTTTGYPCENDLSSVTILSNKSIDGDALSTTAYLLGLDNGLSFINQQENIEAIFITKDKKVYTTNGIKNFEITDKDFELVNK